MTGNISLLLVLLLYLYQLIFIQSLDSAISCRDEDGIAVDWWVLYKLPKKKDKKRQFEKDNNLLSEGLAYAYLSSNIPNDDWTLSSVSISDPKSIAGRTLQKMYGDGIVAGDSDDLFSLMYNDEHPHGPTSSTKGHTKGLVLGDKIKSLWLIHSVPHYPPFPNETYGYPLTGQMYGQTAICISLSTNSSLDTVGRQLTYNTPFIYHTSLPTWLMDYSEMTNAAQGKHIKKAPFFNTENMQTVAGEKFTVFAKSSKFNEDLYADLVASMLKVSLFVETWPNGSRKMPSRCDPPFTVENVDEMNLFTDFRTTHDHAKWAISLDYKRPFVCIGDINRMETQRKTLMGKHSTTKQVPQCHRKIQTKARYI